MRNIIRKILLTEGRKEDARNKYKLVPNEIYQIFVDKDPSGNHKYIDWLMKKADDIDYGADDNRWEYNKQSYIDTTNELMDYVTYFHNNKHKYDENDINQFRNFNHLRTQTKVAKEKVSKSELKKDVKKIYDDGKFMIIIPKSHQASCIYGAGTRWCTTSKDSSHYFEKYKNEGELYYIIGYKAMSQKIAVFISHDGDIQIYNENDDRIEHILGDYLGYEDGVNIGEAIYKHSRESKILFYFLGAEGMIKRNEKMGLPPYHGFDDEHIVKQAAFGNIAQDSEVVINTLNSVYGDVNVDGNGDIFIKKSWCELGNMVNRRQKDIFEALFCDGDLWEYFESQYYYDWDVIWDYHMDDRSINVIREHLINNYKGDTIEMSEYYYDEPFVDWIEEDGVGDYHFVLTESRIKNMTEDTLKLLVEGGDELEDLKIDIGSSYSDAENMAYQDTVYDLFKKGIIDLLGDVVEYVEDDKGYRTGEVIFNVTHTFWEASSDMLTEIDDNENFFTDWPNLYDIILEWVAMYKDQVEFRWPDYVEVSKNHFYESLTQRV